MLRTYSYPKLKIPKDNCSKSGKHMYGCFLVLQSPNNVEQKIQKTTDNTHTTTHLLTNMHEQCLSETPTCTVET